MRVTVVAAPWQTCRPVLQAVVDAAHARGWTLAVRTELEAVPSWARYNYAKYDPAAPLPPTDLLVWLMEPPTAPPEALLDSVPWTVLAGTTLPPTCRRRWTGSPGAPARGWRCDSAVAATGSHVLVVADPVAFFQGLAVGRGHWPVQAVWAGPALPGRLCPAAWWSSEAWTVYEGIGVALATAALYV